MSIKQMLSELIRDANENMFYTVKAEMIGGLKLNAYVDDCGIFHLMLERFGEFPSRNEWEMILNSWPMKLPEPRPAPDKKVGKKYKALVACWRI
jgi:hypothetical protein